MIIGMRLIGRGEGLNTVLIVRIVRPAKNIVSSASLQMLAMVQISSKTTEVLTMGTFTEFKCKCGYEAYGKCGI